MKLVPVAINKLKRGDICYHYPNATKYKVTDINKRDERYYNISLLRIDDHYMFRNESYPYDKVFYICDKPVEPDDMGLDFL